MNEAHPVRIISHQRTGEGRVFMRKNMAILDSEKQDTKHLDLLNDEFDSFTQLLSHPEIIKGAQIDAYVRFSDVTSKSREENESLLISILGLYGTGARIANQVLSELACPLEYSSEDPHFFFQEARSTNGPHADRHERNIDADLLSNVAELGTDIYENLNEDNQILIVALAMAPIFHDASQMIMEYRIATEPNNPTFAYVKARDAHQESAAFLVQALKPLIAKAGHLSPVLTDRLAATLSGIIGLHDKQEQLQRRILGKKITAAQLRTDHIDEKEYSTVLFARYTDGSLDCLRLSPYDWGIINDKTIEHETRGREINRLELYGTYGLGPIFEKMLRKEIHAAKQDMRIPDFDEHPIDIKQWYSTNLLFNVADTEDMVKPGPYAIIRKLLVTQFATSRVTMNPQRDIVDFLNEQRSETNGWNGSELVRMWREFLEVSRLLASTEFFKNEPQYAVKTAHTVLFHLVQSQELIEQIAAGETIGEEPAWVTQIKKTRMVDFSLKIMEKIGVPGLMRKRIKKDFTAKNVSYGTVREFTNSLLNMAYYDSKYTPRFQDRSNLIIQEIDSAVSNLRKKIRYTLQSPNDVIETYSPDVIRMAHDHFQKIVWVQMCNTFGITDAKAQKDLLRGMRTMGEKKLRTTLRIKIEHSYDSAGALADSRTITKRDRDMQMRLENWPRNEVPIPYQFDEVIVQELLNKYIESMKRST